MGCGASAGGTYTIVKQISAEDDDSTLRARSSSKERSPPKESKEMTFHEKHCSDADFALVKTIQEAYPFDENNTRKVDKIEKVRRGNEKVHHWGTVDVAVMTKKLSCDVCHTFILDWKSEAPFYFCKKCRKHDIKFHLCVRCFDTKAYPGSAGAAGYRLASPRPDRNSFSVADWPKSPSRESPQRGRSPNQRSAGNSPGKAEIAEPPASYWGGHLQVRENEHRAGDILIDPRNAYRDPIAVPSPRGLPNRVPSASPRAGREKAPAWLLKSGRWAGTIDEAGCKRHTEYSLRFLPDGEMNGIGPEKCRVTGSVSAFHVEWSEEHVWGTMQARGTVKSEREIIGTFKASDGGGGKIELKAR